MLADYFHRNVHLFPRNDEDQTQEEKLEKRTRVRYVEKATTVEFTRCSTSSSTRDEDTEPFCSRYANFDIVRPRKKKTKRKENRRKERRWFGRVLRDRERSIFMLIGAISRISNFSPVKYHRSKVFHEGGNKSHFMEIARPPNNAQLRPATYSSLFFFLLLSRQVNGSLSKGRRRIMDEKFLWALMMEMLWRPFFVEKKIEGETFSKWYYFWWLFVKKIGERGRGGYEVFSFFWK